MARRPPLPPDYPLANTSVRPRWMDLPPYLRDLVAERCRSPIADAESATTGYTSGFASRLLLVDGSRVFVKAAGPTGDEFADHAVTGYREEARKLAVLPSAVPAPRLRWTDEVRGWFVLCFDDVAGRPPARPWSAAELERVLDAQEHAAEALTPAPTQITTARFVDDFAPELEHWAALADDPIVAGHADEAASLAATGLAAADGTTLVHCDLRDDNVIIGDDGVVWFCDWNWPVIGAGWVDTVTLLLSARGDGLDADGVLADRRLTRDLDPNAVDGLLALLAGYWLVRQHETVPPSSPWVRHHQRWYAAVTWEWLGARRGWR